MRAIGWTLIVIGVGFVLWAFGTATSVHTDMSYVPGVGIEEAKDVVNLGLLQNQMIRLQTGLALFIAGTVTACLGDIRSAMRRAGTAKYDGIFETEAPSDPESPPQTAVTE
jgi:hypothetical protein